jgi:hypothetical protein
MFDDTIQSDLAIQRLELGALTSPAVVRNIRFLALVKGWGRDGSFDVTDDVQRFKVDKYEISGVLGRGGGFGHNGDYRIAGH